MRPLGGRHAVGGFKITTLGPGWICVPGIGSPGIWTLVRRLSRVWRNRVQAVGRGGGAGGSPAAAPAPRVAWLNVRRARVTVASSPAAAAAGLETNLGLSLGLIRQPFFM
jgi:hypothetical protein